MKNQPITSNDVYTLVTNRIIEHLEKGVVPWQKPWTEAGLPTNLVTGNHYKGINVWLLSTLDYPQNYFLTFKQVQDLGGKVKKGEKAQEVIFWKWIEKENPETKEIEKTPLLKYYNVFNIDQCTDIPKEKIPKPVERNIDPIETCEQIIEGMPKRPEIRHEGQMAFYHKTEDTVTVPKRATFDTSEGYYGTLFHELIHSTGHSERLNRKELIDSKGSRTEDYAIEELTAEMGASYLKSYSGIPIEKLENNAAYIESWLGRLKKDKRFIVHASAQAQKASDYILNLRNVEKELELLNEQINPQISEDRKLELEDSRTQKDRTLNDHNLSR